MKSKVMNKIIFAALPLLAGFGAYFLTPVYFSSVINIDTTRFKQRLPVNATEILSLEYYPDENYELINLNLNTGVFKPLLSENLRTEDIPQVRSVYKRNLNNLVVTVSGADRRVVKSAAELLVKELSAGRSDWVHSIRNDIDEMVSDLHLQIEAQQLELIEMQKKLEGVKEIAGNSETESVDKILLDYVKNEYKKDSSNSLKIIEEYNEKSKKLLNMREKFKLFNDNINIKNRKSNAKKKFSFFCVFLLTISIMYIYVFKKNK